MVPRPFARKDSSQIDRLTVGLAVLAAATAGSVIAREVGRLARRRAREAETQPGVLRSAEHALVTAGLAAEDTVAVAIEGYEAASRPETVLFNLLSGFLGAFAFLRFSTFGIRSGWWGGNVRLGGRHIHHFVPGILIGFGSGAAAFVTDSRRTENLLAIPFGIGMGMTFDEAALLLGLRDVYWTREGIFSVQLVLGTSATLGATIIALRMLRRGERRVEARGGIPPHPGQGSLELGGSAPHPVTAE